MPRIRVVPDQLRALSAQLQQVALELRSLEARLGGTFGRLDWAPPERARLEGPVQQARARAQELAGQADAFARQLVAKAQEFETADAEAASALTEIAGAWLAWQAAYKPVSVDEEAPPVGPELPPIQVEIAAPLPVEEEPEGAGGKLKSIEEARPPEQSGSR